MAETEKDQVKRKDKRVLTLFVLMLPSLLLAMTAAIPVFVVRLGFQFVLLIAHFVLIKNLIEEYTGYDYR